MATGELARRLARLERAAPPVGDRLDAALDAAVAALPTSDLRLLLAAGRPDLGDDERGRVDALLATLSAAVRAAGAG